MRIEKSHRHACVALACVLSVATLAGCGSGSDSASDSSSDQAGASGQKTTDVTVAVSTTVGSLQADIADEQGFFAKHGLNAKLVPLTNNTNLPEALGHQFDFGGTYQPVVIAAHSRGINIQAVAGGEIDSKQTPLIDIIVPKDSKIQGPADLAGKRIGTPAVNGIIHLLTLSWIKSAGGDPKSVTGTTVPFAAMEDQLNHGAVDAVETAAPVQQKLIADGFRSLGDPAIGLGNNSGMQTIWASSGSWASQNKETVQKFVAALSDADKYIAANKDDAIAALSKASGVTLDQAKSIPIPPYRAAITVDDIAPYATLMKQLGTLKDDSNPSQYIFSSN